ncbi:MAG: large conductance mechanosensitive channel protein MscL [Pseudomonadota bacterium]
MFQEFKEFIMRGNVVDLAVGIIIGAAFTTIVTSLVEDIIMPPIGLLLGGLDFSNIFIPLDGNSYSSLVALEDAGAPAIKIGKFINAVINFLIVGFAIFMVVKQVNRFRKQEEEAPAEPPRQEVLLEEIRDAIKAGS